MRLEQHFFVVGQLLDQAGDEYAKCLAGRRTFDIQSHTYSRRSLRPGGLTLEELDDEVKRTKELIHKFLGIEAIGV